MAVRHWYHCTSSPDLLSMGEATSMAQPSDITLYLIPSAPTEWDGAHRLQGNADLPLGPSGRQVLMAQLEGLGVTSFGAVLSAPDEASRAGADAVAARAGEKPRVVAGFADADLGLWQGLREEELTERFAKSFSQWRQDPSGVTPPGGESIDEASARILAAFAKATLKARGPVAIIARPIALAVLRSWLRQSPIGSIWPDGEPSSAVETFAAPKERLKELAEALKDVTKASARR